MKVASSNISDIDYAGGTLTVTFKSGHIWEYSGVPVEVWDEFRKAESVGSYFHKNIKGQYSGKDVTPKDDETTLS